MIHCTPVAESERSFCRLGIAIATIVWSMKVIETAKIIAARISLLFLPPVSSMTVAFDARRANLLPAKSCRPFGNLAALMPPVFWIGLGIAGIRLPRRRHRRRQIAHDQPRAPAPRWAPTSA